MNNNIGSIIKSVATVAIVFSIIISFILGFVLDAILSLGGIGFLIGIAFAIILCILIVPTYILGHIIENLEIQTKILQKLEKHFIPQPQTKKKTAATKKEKAAPDNTPVVEYEYFDVCCPRCGETLSFDKNGVSDVKTLTCPFCNCEFEK